MNISLTPSLEQFINQLVESGRFTSATEVVMKGLALLAEQETLTLNTEVGIATYEARLAQLDKDVNSAIAKFQQGGEVAGEITKPQVKDRQNRRPLPRDRVLSKSTISPEEKVRKKAEDAIFYYRCKVIFHKLQPELIETHYKWYIVVEPDSGDYFLDKDEEAVTQIARHKHPNARLFLFQINETGASGTI